MADLMEDEFVIILQGYCGFPGDDSVLALGTEGYSSLEDFATIDSDEQIDNLLKLINKNYTFPPGEHIPRRSYQLLKILLLWTRIQQQLNQELEAEDYDDEEVTFATERYLLAVQYKRTPMPEPAPLTKVFANFANWHSFLDIFTGHCAAIRGAMSIPLSYVLRINDLAEEKDPEEYHDSDAYLMANVALIGMEYSIDNGAVWNLLRPLVYNTPAWDYVKGFDTTNDGRGSIKALRSRGEGTSADKERLQIAEEVLREAKYDARCFY